jgi:hypothetical protein
MGEINEEARAGPLDMARNTSSLADGFKAEMAI